METNDVFSDPINAALLQSQRRYFLNYYDESGNVVKRQLRGILFLTRRLGLHGEAAIAFAKLSIAEQRQYIASLHRLYSGYSAELAQTMADDDITPTVPGGFVDATEMDVDEYREDERVLREALPDLFA